MVELQVSGQNDGGKGRSSNVLYPYQESRRAAEAAVGTELAAMERKHSAERAKLEQERVEMLRLLDEDIAADEDGLRFEAKFEEGS
ncbi:hypothetical protein HO173_007177 [Letharia columbiana]|uniref:Uncharacterized protein n=1 Tax=Letharia columbiana TaxID=112416 RepID=A0A8H6L3V3_9LECA|nr:uncharacterized protein HO173_007177 [Letharia columbiana]KAF6234552.1 hypothetical protein HO173_007177 [Letharia columbiana]